MPPIWIIGTCCVLLFLFSIAALYNLTLPSPYELQQQTEASSLSIDDFNHVFPSSRTQAFILSNIGGMYVLSHVKELSSLKSAHLSSNNITTTVFMFRGDVSKPLYDLFTLHKRAIKYCDNDTTVGGCDVHLPRSYTYSELSLKLLDTLDIMCRVPQKTDYYAKADEDLIMSDSKLDNIIKKMATTDCKVAGGIALDYAFYWLLGQVYIFTRDILETACKSMPYITDVYPSEDITFGLLLNSSDTNIFCGLDRPQNHWHKSYKDKRVKINYR